MFGVERSADEWFGLKLVRLRLRWAHVQLAGAKVQHLSTEALPAESDIDDLLLEAVLPVDICSETSPKQHKQGSRFEIPTYHQPNSSAHSCDVSSSCDNFTAQARVRAE